MRVHLGTPGPWEYRALVRATEAERMAADDLYGEDAIGIVIDRSGLVVSAVYALDPTDDVARKEADLDGQLLGASTELADAAEAVLHQLTRGEASDADGSEESGRDIKWCAETLRAALRKAGSLK